MQGNEKQLAELTADPGSFRNLGSTAEEDWSNGNPDHAVEEEWERQDSERWERERQERLREKEKEN